MSKRVLLSDLISATTAEIRKAQREADAFSKGHVMKFETCEISTAMETEIKSDGSVEIFAVKLGAFGSQKSVNQIKLTFKALIDDEKHPEDLRGVFRGTIPGEAPPVVREKPQNPSPEE